MEVVKKRALELEVFWIWSRKVKSNLTGCV